MKRATEYPECIQMCWAAWKCLRQLKFSADDIFVFTAKNAEIAPDESIFSFVEVRRGKKKFTLTILRISPLTEDEFKDQWVEFAERWNLARFKDKDMRKIYHRFIRGIGGEAGSAAMLSKMIDKGLLPHVQH